VVLAFQRAGRSTLVVPSVSLTGAAKDEENFLEQQFTVHNFEGKTWSGRPRRVENLAAKMLYIRMTTLRVFVAVCELD
jgi:hypothetical protein